MTLNKVGVNKPNIELPSPFYNYNFIKDILLNRYTFGGVILTIVGFYSFNFYLNVSLTDFLINNLLPTSIKSVLKFLKIIVVKEYFDLEENGIILRGVIENGKLINVLIKEDGVNSYKPIFNYLSELNQLSQTGIVENIDLIDNTLRSLTYSL